MIKYIIIVLYKQTKENRCIKIIIFTLTIVTTIIINFIDFATNRNTLHCIE